MPDSFIYVYAHYHYSKEVTAKVGVSVKPESRSKNFRYKYQSDGFVFVKKWQMNRDDAFALEALVCRSFRRYWRREWLNATPEEVCQFIEDQLKGAKNG
jgi:hypothetical protein